MKISVIADYGSLNIGIGFLRIITNGLCMASSRLKTQIEIRNEFINTQIV
jgi:hypothetical protein